MMTPTDISDLAGKLLVAMPRLGDPRFGRAVVFVCVHSDQGAMGLIVNRPAPDLSFDTLLGQLHIPAGRGACPIHVGGPMEAARGFVLHSPTIESDSTLEVPPRFGMTTTPDILRAISRGEGPGMALLALGYAGWGPGQLESEILRDDWLICEATTDLVFAADNGAKWTRAMASIGVNPVTLSGQGGRA